MYLTAAGLFKHYYDKTATMRAAGLCTTNFVRAFGAILASFAFISLVMGLYHWLSLNLRKKYEGPSSLGRYLKKASFLMAFISAGVNLAQSLFKDGDMRDVASILQIQTLFHGFAKVFTTECVKKEDKKINFQKVGKARAHSQCIKGFICEKCGFYIPEDLALGSSYQMGPVLEIEKFCCKCINISEDPQDFKWSKCFCDVRVDSNFQESFHDHHFAKLEPESWDFKTPSQFISDAKLFYFEQVERVKDIGLAKGFLFAAVLSTAMLIALVLYLHPKKMQKYLSRAGTLFQTGKKATLTRFKSMLGSTYEANVQYPFMRYEAGVTVEDAIIGEYQDEEKKDREDAADVDEEFNRRQNRNQRYANYDSSEEDERVRDRYDMDSDEEKGKYNKAQKKFKDESQKREQKLFKGDVNFQRTHVVARPKPGAIQIADDEYEKAWGDDFEALKKDNKNLQNVLTKSIEESNKTSTAILEALHVLSGNLGRWDQREDRFPQEFSNKKGKVPVENPIKGKVPAENPVSEKKKESRVIVDGEEHKVSKTQSLPKDKAPAKTGAPKIEKPWQKNKAKDKTNKIFEATEKCCGTCPGMKMKKVDGKHVYSCKCEKKKGFEAKQPNAHLFKVGTETKGAHIARHLVPCKRVDGELLGHSFVIKDKAGVKWLVFNRHFLDHDGPHAMFNGVAFNLTKTEGRRFKNTDLMAVKVPSNIVVKNINISKYPDNYTNNVTLFTKIDDELYLSVGSSPKIVSDVSGSFVHCTTNYHSEEAFCGSAISLDCMTVCGIHYHTNGTGSGNNFIPFTTEAFDWLVEPTVN